MIALAVVWAAGELLVEFGHIPIPGSIVGMVFLILVFASGRLSSSSVKRGAEFYLGEMLLFFIPAVLAILDHHEFFGTLGIKLLFVIGLGTIVVMLVTAFAVDLTLRLVLRKDQNK